MAAAYPIPARLSADRHTSLSSYEDAIVLRAFVEAGGAIAPNLIVHGLADPVMVEVAKAAGVTHASLQPELRATALQVDAA